MYAHAGRPNECPKDTPWGRWQDKRIYAGGEIAWVSTASHGGFWVSPKRFSEMPENLRVKTYAGEGWFEEDCDWCLVHLSFPDVFNDPYALFQALQTFRGWQKERIPAFEASEAGKRIIAQCDEYLRVNGHLFQPSSSGSGSQRGRSWDSGVSLDRKTRIEWEEVSPRDFREIANMKYLRAPYSLEEAEARAIRGTFKVAKAIECQECGQYLFHERELKNDCAKAIPVAGKPGNHTIGISDLLQWEDWQLCG